MEIADPVSSILEHKGSSQIYSVVADDTVFDAIQLMAEKNIGAALGIPPERVGIKATTNETMGFVGRKEGIAALAVAQVD